MRQYVFATFTRATVVHITIAIKKLVHSTLSTQKVTLNGHFVITKD